MPCSLGTCIYENCMHPWEAGRPTPIESAAASAVVAKVVKKFFSFGLWFWRFGTLIFFKNRGTQNGWFIMETLLKWMIWEYHDFPKQKNWYVAKQNCGHLNLVVDIIIIMSWLGNSSFKGACLNVSLCLVYIHLHDTETHSLIWNWDKALLKWLRPHWASQALDLKTADTVPRTGKEQNLKWCRL